MAPLITNGDRHWCQWRWGAPLVPLRPSPLEPMDRHWQNFLSPLASMARTPKYYDIFTHFGKKVATPSSIVQCHEDKDHHSTLETIFCD